MANITRYDPSSPLSARDFFDRFFDKALSDSFWSNGMDEGTLPVDISETESAVLVRASLPGFSGDEVDVQLHQGVLSIKAEHRQEEASGNERYHRRERSWRSLSRRIALPGIIHDAEVEASMKDGVLTLRIPVPEQAKPRRIAVKAEA